jgi:hypothetical protein
MQDDVLSAIKSGKAKMQPKWRYVLRTCLTITALVIIFFILIYIASFIIFILHESGAWFVPVFGFHGWYDLFNAVPWLLICFSGIFILLLALLVHKYPFSYTRPFIYSLLGILFLIAAGCVLIVQTSLEHEFFAGPDMSLPIIGGFYGGFGVPVLEDVHHGTVLLITSDGFVMEDLHQRPLTVILSSSTAVREATALEPGDGVVIFGPFFPGGTSTIEALGVEQLSAE